VEAISLDLPLIVITGPTASGKTALAIELAAAYDGEIICADSRTVYRGMDIGTAKPTEGEQKTVSHWGLDLVEPDEYFSAADFKKYADQKIIEIRNRGHTPFLVGGTGLYIDAVVFDYQFGAKTDSYLRAELGPLTLEELYEYCDKNNIQLPENKKNKRYVIRAIETATTVPSRLLAPVKNTIIVGITTDKVLLRERIAKRSEQLFEDGVVEEATKLGNKYGWESEAMTSNIYPLVHQYLNNELSLSEAVEKNEIRDWRLAKRQMTWLRRNSFIQWFSLIDAKKYLSEQLAIYK
jgi:tRNA dimethylallyltransferase